MDPRPTVFKALGLALSLAVAAVSSGCDHVTGPSGPSGPSSPRTGVRPSGIPSYEVTVIPAKVGRGINGSGDVVGWASGPLPFLWTAEDGLIVLPTSSDPYGIAYGVSERSGGEVVVVGQGRGDGFSGLHALRWRVAVPGGTVLEVTDLGTVGDFSSSEARGVNAAGEIVGNLDPDAISSGTFYYSDATGMLDMGFSGSFSRAQAFRINDLGVAVGYDSSVAFRWTLSGGVEYLGVPPDFAFSFGFDINDAGQVSAGVTSSTGNSERVARYTDGVGWEILGGAGETNLGWGINELGDVVGEGIGQGGTGFTRGVIYTDELGVLTDLNTLLADPNGEWQVMNAYDINDARQITGWATSTTTGESVAVLLTDVGGGEPPPADAPPVADFTWSCDDSLTCTFDGRASTDDDGIVLYEWIVNGVVRATGETFTRSFRSPTTFDLTLRVTDTGNQTDEITKTVEVQADPTADAPPVADFTWSCDDSLTCTFDGRASTDDDGIVLYEWIVNGIVRATGETFTRSFRQPTTFDLTLRVTDTANQTDEVTKTVSVP